MDFEYIKKVIESDGTLKIAESSDNMLVIVKEDISSKTEEIKELLVTFGVVAEDVTVSENGTIVDIKSVSSTKLQLLLSPFLDIENLIVQNANTLLIRGLFIQMDIIESKVQEDSIDDVPASEGVVAVQSQSDVMTNVEDCAKLIDTNTTAEITIVSDTEFSVTTTDEIVKFLTDNEAKFANFDVTISSDVITF